MSIAGYIILGAVLGWFGNDQFTPTCAHNPLVEASCPMPVPPVDDSFGATTYSLSTTVGQYRECRAACLRGGK